MYLFKTTLLVSIMIYVLGYSDTSTVAKNKIGILPSAYYTPETNLAFGAICFANFKTCKDSITRMSNAQLYLDYTLNHQYLSQADYTIFFHKNNYYLKGSIDFIRFPDLFFGIGNATELQNVKKINYTLLKFNKKFYKQIKNNIYIGALFNLDCLYDMDMEIMDPNKERTLHGNMGYKSSSGGVGLLIDHRNQLLNPSRGYYLESNLERYSVVDQPGFTSFVIDARSYHNYKNKLVLNVNLFSGHRFGKVPFGLMYMLGGPRFLRGYYMGRFRDNHMSLLQFELRMPVYKRLGIAAFSGVGQVYEKPQNFAFDQFHANAGMGLRFKIDRENNVNIRLDFGLTKDSYGIYVVYAEAF